MLALCYSVESDLGRAPVDLHNGTLCGAGTGRVLVSPPAHCLVYSTGQGFKTRSDGRSTILLSTAGCLGHGLETGDVVILAMIFRVKLSINPGLVARSVQLQERGLHNIAEGLRILMRP